MELYYVVTIVDRNKRHKMYKLIHDMKFSLDLSCPGYGTATSEHLLLYDLQKTEKIMMSVVATKNSAMRLFQAAEEKLCIDIPGNGLMMSIPIKSVAGADTLEFLSKNQKIEGGKPNMNFEYELIIAILNEGYSEEVMDAAREAGAGGGTVLHAKGKGPKKDVRFLGVSIAENKDMLYIVSSAENKTAIMQNVYRKCGVNHPSNTLCFSLPVSEVTGIRRLHQSAQDEQRETADEQPYGLNTDNRS